MPSERAKTRRPRTASATPTCRRLPPAPAPPTARSAKPTARPARPSAIGIGSLFALIDPAPVAFVGGGAAAFDLLEPHIRAAIAQTAGGQHSDAISFDTVPDELPLIREGCAMRALAFVDQEIFAAGLDALESAGKEVA